MKGQEEMLEGKGVINFSDCFTGAYNATTHQIVTSTTCVYCRSSYINQAVKRKKRCHDGGKKSKETSLKFTCEELLTKE